MLVTGHVINVRTLLTLATVLYPIGSSLVVSVIFDAVSNAEEIAEFANPPCNCSATVQGDVAAVLEDPAVVEAIAAALGRQYRP